MGRSDRKGETGEVYAGVRFMAARSNTKARRRLFALSAMSVAVALWALFADVRSQPVLTAFTAFVFARSAVGSFRSAAVMGRLIFDESFAGRIAGPLRELCSQAKCPTPTVAIRNDRLVAMGVYRRKKSLILLVSKPLMDDLSDDELRALLAHEIIHIVHNDLADVMFRVKLASVLAVIAYYVAFFGAGGRIADVPFGWAVGAVVFKWGRYAMSRANQGCEWQADAEGAALTGDPGSLATALLTTTSAVRAARAAGYGGWPWKWLLFPANIRPLSHPPVAFRVEGLEELGHMMSESG